MKPVGLIWKGREYTVPANRVMELIDTVEDVITLEEMHGAGHKRGKLSRAFSDAVNFAASCSGQHLSITPEEVYRTLFGIGEGASVSSVILGIQSLLIPPEAVQREMEKHAPKPVPKKPAKKRASRKKATASAS